MVKVDFSQDVRKALDGTFPATLTGYEEGLSKANQPTSKWKWVLTDDENRGRVVMGNKSLQNHVLWSWKKWAVAMGANPEEIVGTMDTMDVGPQLVGNNCRLVLGPGQTDEWPNVLDVLSDVPY